MLMFWLLGKLLHLLASLNFLICKNWIIILTLQGYCKKNRLTSINKWLKAGLYCEGGDEEEKEDDGDDGGGVSSGDDGDGGKDADGRRGEKIELVKKKEESLQTSPPLASTELIVGKYHCIRNQLYIFSPKEHRRNIEMYFNRTIPC